MRLRLSAGGTLAIYTLSAGAAACLESGSRRPAPPPLPAGARPRAFAPVSGEASEGCASPLTAVARDSAAWTRLAACAPPGVGGGRVLGASDFARSMAVLVAPRHASYVTGAEIDAVFELHDTLVVRAAHRVAGPGCLVQPAVTQAAAAALTARWDGPVRFEVRRAARPCGD